SSNCSIEARGVPMSGALRQHDVRPGGHAKWVQIPHGPATVSGEGHLLDTPLGARKGLGRREVLRRPASQDTWSTGGVFFRRARRREEPQCFSSAWCGWLEPSVRSLLLSLC